MFERRKNKQQIIEQEQSIELGIVDDPKDLQRISQSTLSYTHAAKWFESNVADDYKRSATNAKRLAVFFAVLAFMSIAAVLGLTPLKTVVPYLVRVDNNTGASDLVPVVSDVRTQDQTDDDFWLSSYVRFREGYNFADNDAIYNIVETMSYSDTFQEYKNFQLSKKGYTDTLGNSRQMRVSIIGVTPLARKPDDPYKTVQVRITKTVVDRNGVPDASFKPATWLMTVSFDYKNPAKKREQELVNPRGLGVRSYSSVQEVGVNNG
ncbi:virB8 family protein [Pseudomonas fluorescens]|uniref:Conjugal transfer protein n=1 Tax=Pseudomonas fluorescens TaxID=294 RepID=A0A2T0HN22_PSEFL|nr:type IV secretion system protein [Pseudomonas fluorescens]PRW84482.1 conjugal transfer protein [Pseudomonas fluorescens]